MLSRSLPLNIGWGCALRMYLEDTIIESEEALISGLINTVATTPTDTHNIAREWAIKYVAQENHFYIHGLVSRICLHDKNQINQEIVNHVTSTLIDSIAIKNNPKVHNESLVNLKPISNTSNNKWENRTHDEIYQELFTRVMTAVNNHLAVDAENLEQPFVDLGLDSLGSTELSHTLSIDMDMDLSSTITFEYPTVNAITQYLFELLTVDNNLVEKVTSLKEVIVDMGNETMAPVKEMLKPVVQKLRGLFLHGSQTNALAMEHFLNITGWSSGLIEWTVPQAPSACNCLDPQIAEALGMGAMSTVFDMKEYFRWGLVNKSDLIPWNETDADLYYQEWLKSEIYLLEFIRLRGPFDVIGGISEGAAAVSAIIHRQAVYNYTHATHPAGIDFGINLVSVKLILVSGYCDLNLIKYHQLYDICPPLRIPSLHISGYEEPDQFKVDWFPPLRSCFSLPIIYEHPGNHVLPLMNTSLQLVINGLLNRQPDSAFESNSDINAGIDTIAQYLRPMLLLTDVTDPPISDDHLLCLQLGDSNRIPIVFIYSIFGTVCGKELIDFVDKGQPIYATQGPEYSSPECFTSIKERAGYHTDIILNKFRKGIHLVGYSLGGQIAFEIAQLLQDAGVYYYATTLASLDGFIRDA